MTACPEKYRQPSCPPALESAGLLTAHLITAHLVSPSTAFDLSAAEFGKPPLKIVTDRRATSAAPPVQSPVPKETPMPKKAQACKKCGKPGHNALTCGREPKGHAHGRRDPKRLRHQYRRRRAGAPER